MSKEAIYLGDGVYAELETGLIKLWTIREEGEHQIYLGGEEWAVLKAWVEESGKKYTAKIGS